ncbi:MULTISPECIES: type II toxin-antitoxin system HicB family antitoxin [Pantoea]|jgi:predicted RNase H-like HicB family nuclease|uniref:Type II toxin-antitoxin system HicB family antitoxin n=1 Tax=Pantoea dispersa TaxID=59814 RepID=A0ABY3A395_9GAMM|nr:MULTISPECIES: type II toxin-antitoxin system HicB family antitoxin [Pantoea]MBK4770888.1 type II toxin-antitoxin system HicB family antitoxin [Pantoea sp. Morm]MBK4786144.1 type II toxin-antitoxin system HicB family antitoxin [Pantoea sp. Pent]KAA6101463.1 type II toxin-antitoxin system HicB family antitoxin [Pantoea sp. B_9]KAA6111253.1 type II toxin-antitoxin system HicB family antitoxin [Pantoea sp. B_10]KTS33240.1 phage-like protein [Pantoea dispersa]
MFYPIAIEAGDETTAYGVTVPDLPGCFSAGDTLEEAVKNAKEAITGHLELMVELGQDIPAVSDLKSLMKSAEFAGYVWVLVDVDVTRILGGSEKINVTLPKLLIDRIDRCVATHPEFKTRSGFLAQVALERIAKTR